MEDTFHNDANADKKTNGLTDEVKKEFSKMKKLLLYSVMPEDELVILVDKMKTLVQGHQSTTNWVNRIGDAPEIRTATHTTKIFSCSEKGATSRCETSMTRLKMHGDLKAVMRKWTIPELQARHRQVVEDYEENARKGIKLAIKNGDVFSPYVVDKEAEELQHVQSLRIVDCTEDVSNPFHGVLQSSGKTIVINMNRPMDATSLGLGISVGESDGTFCLVVDLIYEGSLFEGSQLEAGMKITTINGEKFASRQEGVDMLKAVEGNFTIWVDTLPRKGMVYTIAHLTNDKMERTVFIPHLSGKYRHHCQSNFHVHTAFWIRDRYIQRALMQHPSRTTRDDTTNHFRWHITHSPLYQIEYESLVSMMRVDGLGLQSLPAFLKTQKANRTPLTCNDDDEVYHPPPKIVVPSSKAKRYSEANTVAGRIVELAKLYPDVFRMVMPQLNHIRDNCVLMREAAQDTLNNNNSKVPIAPAVVTRGKEDDVNQHHAAKKSKSTGK